MKQGPGWGFNLDSLDLILASLLQVIPHPYLNSLESLRRAVAVYCETRLNVGEAIKGLSVRKIMFVASNSN